MRSANSFLTAVVGLAASVALFSGANRAAANDWPAWRGDGNGISAEKNLPVYWSPAAGIAWKTALPGQGNSSPIIVGERVYLTAWDDGGKKRSVLCLDAKDGKIVWQKDLAAERTPPTDGKNGYSSPTPVCDGERIYAFFDSPGLVALDLAGNVLWTRDLGPFENVWNMAASPVLCNDVVIVNCDHDKGSFIAAVDQKSGKVRWRTLRQTGRQFASPITIKVDGKPQIVVNGQTVISYDPDNGKELWSCRGMMQSATPTAVYANGLVYVGSGRNGPAMAIDPTGRGDLTETGVKMHVTIGGPYVPSPLVYPSLFLPGDDGLMKFIGADGSVILKERIQGHFSSSPVAGDNKIYWASEKGDVYVIDVSGVSGVSGASGATPKVQVLAINKMQEKILASPAIANGRILLRTEKNLYSIAGAREAAPPVLAQTTGSFDELKKRFTDHPAAVGDDVLVRIEVVEALAQLKDPQAIPLLMDAAQKDEHWDVSEAAVKALGLQGEPAIPSLIALIEDKNWRPYLKIIPADHLARMGSVEAVPALVKATGHSDALVRVACIEALAKIAAAHEDQASAAIPAFIRALADRESVVKRAAIESLAKMPDKVGEDREALVQKLLECAADRSPLVAKAAADALTVAFKASPDLLARDQILYGEQRKEPLVHQLKAGPVSLKFQDGELRYIYAGQKEIVRRVYFAVRDERWDTVMPEFTSVNVQKQENSFKIRLSAISRNDIADFRWSGDIVGTAEGKITFTINGQANMDYKAPRVGLCVLFGAESLAGQAYEVTDKDGKATPGEWPKNVSPVSKLLANNFQTLLYRTADGMEVSANLAPAGGIFGMEDQRNFGDSSYKAFSSMAYKYPAIVKGEKKTQVFTLDVKGAKAEPMEAGPARVTVGQAVDGAKMPAVVSSAAVEKPVVFLAYNREAQKYADAELVAFPYNPAAHMPDDDTFMENVTSLVDQVRTVRAFAPKAKVRVDPIGFNSPYLRPSDDARNRGLFGAAWCARVMKYLALGGVDEAAFKVGPGYAELAQKDLAQSAGKRVLACTVAAVGPAPVDALAVEADDKRIVWLMNLTDQPQKLVLGDLGNATTIQLSPAERHEQAGRGAGIRRNRSQGRATSDRTDRLRGVPHRATRGTMNLTWPIAEARTLPRYGVATANSKSRTRMSGWDCVGCVAAGSGRRIVTRLVAGT